MVDPEPCPTPHRTCPFDGEARDRITILEVEAKHSRAAMTQMAADTRAMRVDLDKMVGKFDAALSKIHGGWWVLVQITTAAMAIGGCIAWMLPKLAHAIS